MDTNIEQYLTRLLPEDKPWIKHLRYQAQADEIPIMEQSGIHVLCQLITMIKPKQILEIGTGIGYSALRMLDAYPKTLITTIERDEQRYRQAKQVIHDHGKQTAIHVRHGDALEVLKKLEKQRFHLIFIDAAKGKYKHFFELSQPLLADHGLIVSDNVLFRGYVFKPERAPKRFKSLVTKLDQYNEWLMNHPDYITSILPVGDGVAISYKK